MTDVVADTADMTEPVPSTLIDHPHKAAPEVGDDTKSRRKAWMWAAVAAVATVGIATASMIISNDTEKVRTAGAVIPDTIASPIPIPSAAPMTSTPPPALHTLNVLGTAEEGYVACNDPTQTPSITFQWDATDATIGWVTVDEATASPAPEAATPPNESETSSTGSSVVPFDCASNQHTYTLYLQGAGGTTTTTTSYNASRPSSESPAPSEPGRGQTAQGTDPPAPGGPDSEFDAGPSLDPGPNPDSETKHPTQSQIQTQTQTQDPLRLRPLHGRP